MFLPDLHGCRTKFFNFILWDCPKWKNVKIKSNKQSLLVIFREKFQTRNQTVLVVEVERQVHLGAARMLSWIHNWRRTPTPKFTNWFCIRGVKERVIVKLSRGREKNFPLILVLYLLCTKIWIWCDGTPNWPKNIFWFKLALINFLFSKIESINFLQGMKAVNIRLLLKNLCP